MPLGQWVLEEACSQLCAWQHAIGHATPAYVSVNVSVRQLAWPGFPNGVACVLERSCLPQHSLVLEITEGLLADDRDALIRQLRGVKALGVRVAVDDFGTGYSALSHL